MFEVRVALPEDRTRVEEVREAAVAILRRVYRPDPVRLSARGGRRAGGTRLVALDGDQVVGTLTYDRSGTELHVWNLAVDPAFHRRGVARSLIEAVCGLAREQGLDGVTADTILETGNVPIFERLGFRVVASESPSRLMAGVGGEPVTDVRLRRGRDTL